MRKPIGLLIIWLLLLAGFNILGYYFGDKLNLDVLKAIIQVVFFIFSIRLFYLSFEYFSTDLERFSIGVESIILNLALCYLL